MELIEASRLIKDICETYFDKSTECAGCPLKCGPKELGFCKKYHMDEPDTVEQIERVLTNWKEFKNAASRN